MATIALDDPYDDPAIVSADYSAPSETSDATLAASLHAAFGAAPVNDQSECFDLVESMI